MENYLIEPIEQGHEMQVMQPMYQMHPMQQAQPMQPICQLPPMPQRQFVQQPIRQARSYNTYRSRKAERGAFYDEHSLSRLHEVFFVVVIACSILTFISLLKLTAAVQHGWGFFLHLCFGAMSYCVPFLFVYAGITLYIHWRSSQTGFSLMLKLIGAGVFFSALLCATRDGSMGLALSNYFFDFNSSLESSVMLLAAMFSGVLLMTRLSCFHIAVSVVEFFSTREESRIFRNQKKHVTVPVETETYIPRQEPILNNIKPYSPYYYDAQSRQLLDCLANFNIQATTVGKEIGPVVTRYEIDLAPGVKSSTLCSLHKEIARSLKVQNVRVLEVISGKSAIGIEIPNQNREIFSFESLSHNLDCCENRQLPLLLGKTASGDIKIVDLRNMVHMLVAGSTKSGKTNLLQSMLMSLTHCLSPQDLRIILIDPKCVAFSPWKNVPHLLMPIITDGDEAIDALNFCVNEMERRYEMMAESGQQNFPSIVVFVDEVADLVMTHKNEIEDTVKRLAQKARQSDIHLILSTQRPTVDVITGHIKTNMPARIALSVSDKINSRNIIDENGAENLLWHGDMLLKFEGSCERLHAAYVSDDAVREHVSRLIESTEDQFQDNVTSQQSNIMLIDFKKNRSEIQEKKDTLFDEVVEHIKVVKKASISNIQSRFRIGFQRASNIMAQLEAKGFIGDRDKQNGGREVLIS